MSYHIKVDESVQAAVRRIARDQIDRAIGEIEDSSLDAPETVHQIRKRCKKIRGLIRLVRPQFEDTYAEENAWYRDAARDVSYVRDAQSAAKTYESLLDCYADQVDRAAFSSIEERLVEQRDTIYGDEGEIEQRLEMFLVRLRTGRKRIDDWHLADDGFVAVAGGLRKTYGRGRRAMADAYDEETTAAFHEWRKRTKYHWYHARLLKLIWPEPMKEYAHQAHQLADYLGDEHDLGVLRQMLHEDPEPYGDAATLQAFIGLIDRRRVVLRSHAQPLGLRLFCERPKRLAKRFGCYWTAWHCVPDALA